MCFIFFLPIITDSTVVINGLYRYTQNIASSLSKVCRVTACAIVFTVELDKHVAHPACLQYSCCPKR